MRLNLGCSTDLFGGEWTNVDIAPPCDQVADLSLPWPWSDSTVDEIYAADIFEHIGDCLHGYADNCTRCSDGDPRGNETTRHWSGRIHVMNESWRVLKPGGILTMECPDAAKGAGQWQDPQHVSAWTPNGLQYYCLDYRKQDEDSAAVRRFAEAYGITARFKVLSVTERKYEEIAGPAQTGGGPAQTGGQFSAWVRCEVWKFRAILEAVK